jgi:hypothetical protein
MAKKGLLVLVLLGTLAAGAFAQAEFRFGMGLGGFFICDFGGEFEKSMSDTFQMSMKFPYMGAGGLIFFDVTYAELSVGFFVGESTFEGESSGSSAKSAVSYTGLDIGLLGKYPFEISDAFSVFPLLGASYRLMLSAEDAEGNSLKSGDKDAAPEVFNAIWFKLGCGLDISFSDNIHLRVEVLYGMRLLNQYENDWLESKPPVTVGPGEKGQVHSKTQQLGHGPEAKIGVGYKF